MRKLNIKEGVVFKSIPSPILSALKVVLDIWTYHNKTPTVTSANDGQHMVTSLHYKNLALDLRIKDLPEPLIVPMFNKLKETLGSQYDVVLEEDHIHLEYDPK